MRPPLVHLVCVLSILGSGVLAHMIWKPIEWRFEIKDNSIRVRSSGRLFLSMHRPDQEALHIVLTYDERRCPRLSDLMTVEEQSEASERNTVDATGARVTYHGGRVVAQRALGKWERSYAADEVDAFTLRIREPTALKSLSISAETRPIVTMQLAQVGPNREHHGIIADQFIAPDPEPEGRLLRHERESLLIFCLLLLFIANFAAFTGLPIHMRLVVALFMVGFAFWGVRGPWLPWRELPLAPLGGYATWFYWSAAGAPICACIARAYFAFERRVPRFGPLRTRRVVGAAIALAIMTILGVLVPIYGYESVPFCGDDVGYLFQARIFSDFRAADPWTKLYDVFPMMQTLVSEDSETIAGKYWPGTALHYAIGMFLGLWRLPMFLLGLATLYLVPVCGKRLWGSTSAGAFSFLALLTSTAFLLSQTSALSQVPMFMYQAGFLYTVIEFTLRRQTKPFRLGLVAGACLGMVGLCRPLDMVLIGLAGAVGCLLNLKRVPIPRLLRFGVATAVMCAALCSVSFVHAWLATEKWTPLFSQFGENDRPGFGEDVIHPHSPLLGMQQSSDNMRYAESIASFLPLGIALIAIFITSARRAPAVIAVILAAALNPFAYTTMFWKGGIIVGPLYQAAMCIPISILAGGVLAAGYRYLGTRLPNQDDRRAITAGLVVFPLVLSAAIGVITLLDINRPFIRGAGAPRALANAAGVEQGIVFVQAIPERRPDAAIWNDWRSPPEPKGIICALDQGSYGNYEIRHAIAPDFRIFLYMYDPASKTEFLIEQ